MKNRVLLFAIITMPLTLQARPICVELVDAISVGSYGEQIKSEIAAVKARKDLEINKVKSEFETDKVGIRKEFHERKIKYISGEIETERSTLASIQEIAAKLGALREWTSSLPNGEGAIDNSILQELHYSLSGLSQVVLQITKSKRDEARINSQIHLILSSITDIRDHQGLNIENALFDLERSVHLLRLQSESRIQALTSSLDFESGSPSQETEQSVKAGQEKNTDLKTTDSV